MSELHKSVHREWTINDVRLCISRVQYVLNFTNDRKTSRLTLMQLDNSLLLSVY